MIDSGTVNSVTRGRAAGPPNGFSVVDARGRLVDGPFPSFDIASIVAQQTDLAHVNAWVAAGSSVYRDYLAHARRWFGGRVAGWLVAGMPAGIEMPPAPDLATVNPRILARNGDAIAAYLGDGPEAPACSFYDRIVARYARAAHGAVLAPATVRVALEPIHASLALRQMCRDYQQHRVVAAESGPILSITREEAGRRLKDAACLYRGLDRNWLFLFDDPGVWGRWARYCRRSVLLPGVTAVSAYWAARDLLRSADIHHGIDAGEPSRALRHVLLHLAQWRLVSVQSSECERRYRSQVPAQAAR